MLVDFRPHPVDIQRMNAAKPFTRTLADRLARVTEHRLPARAVIDLVGCEVPVPEAIVCPLGRQGVAFLAEPKGLKGLLPRDGVTDRVSDRPLQQSSVKLSL